MRFELTRYRPSRQGLKTKSAGFSESLHAVVDHDGDHAHGDGQSRHPGEDRPDAANAIDDGANHRTDFDGSSGAVNAEIKAEWLKRFSVPSRSGARLALLPRRRCSHPTLELVQPTIDFHECLDQVTNELVRVKATLRHAGVAQALGDVLKRWAHDELLPLLPDLLLAA